MIVVILLGLLSCSRALSLLDLHDERIPIRPYTKDNVLHNEDGTISLTEYQDMDYPDEQRTHIQSIPIIEAPVAMSNPIWKIFSRASDLYRIFRRSYKVHPNTDSSSPSRLLPSTPAPASFPKKPMKNPRGWQLFLR